MYTQPELKPCPFCGSKEISIEYYKETEDDAPYWQICCDMCGTMSGKCFIDYEYINQAHRAYLEAAEKVVDRWNNRKGE